jgi:trigger factor
MNVSIETMTGLERRLTIALPSEQFENQITERLEDARGRVSISGFRPGKVPIKEVRRRYGRSVRAEVAGELMQSSFVSAVQQEELNPAGSPNLEVVKMDPGIDFEFTATFEVFPSIDIADLGKVNVRKPEAEITDEDMQNMVTRLRDQRTTYEPVERAVLDGDQIKADFSATLDGEPVEGTAGDDVDFRVGQGQMIEDFDKGVLGAEAGQTVEFDATFPDDYRAEDLQGKTVQFSVTVKEVKESKVPELDDEFFKGFGVEEGGEEAFLVEVRENMQRELDGTVKNQLKQQVMDQLADLHDFQLPQAIVVREIQVLKDQMLGQFQMGGDGPKPELPDELFSDQAEKRVKIGLVVNEVISKQSLEVDQALLDERLAEIASQYGEPEQVISYYRSNPEQLQNIEMGVLEEQVIDHILSSAQVETVESSYDEILSGQAVVDPDAETESDEEQAEDTAALGETAADTDTDTDSEADAETEK